MFLRILPILLIALALAPGTFVRTPVTRGFDKPITLHAVDEPGEEPPAGWTLEGVWEYRGSGRAFGGFSALLALPDNTLRAFSDRGTRFTFREPDMPQVPFKRGDRLRPPTMLDLQLVAPDYWKTLWDIESATNDPQTGQYWLGYESLHAIQRFNVRSEVEDLRIIDDEVDWSVNSGAEAMVRLRDGRFVIIPESGGEGLIYPDDPNTGAMPATFAYDPPLRGFGITDATELPDGRLLLLVRKVVWGVPPFDVRIAIADLPRAGEPQVMKPEFIVDLTAIAPRDNYEGIALKEREDGTLDIWVISDDNLSAIQRTLVVKFRLDPEAMDAADEAKVPAEATPVAEPADQPKQKARE